MGQNESKAAAGGGDKHTGRPSEPNEHNHGRSQGRAHRSTNSKSRSISSKRKALVRTFSRRKGKQVKTQLLQHAHAESERGLSADISCGGGGATATHCNNLPSASSSVRPCTHAHAPGHANPSTREAQRATENYGHSHRKLLSEIPRMHLGVSESAARHPHRPHTQTQTRPSATPPPCSAPHHHKQPPGRRRSRSSSAAAPAAPPTSETKRGKTIKSKTSSTPKGPQNQRKCAEANKSTLSRHSRKNKFGFGRPKGDKASVSSGVTTEKATPTPLVALPPPPPRLPPKPARLQRTRTQQTDHRHQPAPTSHQCFAPTSASSKQQPRSYSYFTQSSQNPPNFPKSQQAPVHSHYPSLGHTHYPNIYPTQSVTHTQVPAHHAHLYEQTPNSKVVPHKLTAVEEQICFPATGVHSGNFHHIRLQPLLQPQPQPVSSAFPPHDAHRRPSTAYCRSRAPAVVLPHYAAAVAAAAAHGRSQHPQQDVVSPLVYTQSGALTHHQEHGSGAPTKRLSETTNNTSNSSSTGYSCPKRPSFFAPTYPGEVHKLSTGDISLTSQVYTSHRASVTQASHAAHPTFQQDHSLTPSHASGVYPHPCTGQQHTTYSGLTACNAGEAGAVVNQMGNLMGYVHYSFKCA